MVVIYAAALSRVLKGVHSYNQVFSGMVQGCLLTLLMIVFYEDLFLFYLNLRYMSLQRLIFSPVVGILSMLGAFAIFMYRDTSQNFVMP